MVNLKLSNLKAQTNNTGFRDYPVLRPLGRFLHDRGNPDH